MSLKCSMSHTSKQVLAAATLTLVAYSHGSFAFDFTSADKFSAVGKWRIHHESGKVSVCDRGGYSKTMDYKTAPKCSPWSKSLGKGSFQLVRYPHDQSDYWISVIDTKSGRIAYCGPGNSLDRYPPVDPPICSPLSKD